MKYFLTEPEQQDREVLLTASYEAEKEPPPPQKQTLILTQSTLTGHFIRDTCTAPH